MHPGCQVNDGVHALHYGGRIAEQIMNDKLAAWMLRPAGGGGMPGTSADYAPSLKQYGDECIADHAGRARQQYLVLRDQLVFRQTVRLT
jgi:hypothetical protein